jgi:hypothetical protein
MDAYADFIQEAAAGSFRAPAAGGLTAEQIVAHVARNHEELIAVTESVLAGDEVTYDNREPTGRELDRYLAGYGGLAGLADRVAQTVTVLRDLTARLDERGTVRVQSSLGDPPMPWAKVLELDETVNVPRWLGQLRELRAS